MTAGIKPGELPSGPNMLSADPNASPTQEGSQATHAQSNNPQPATSRSAPAANDDQE